MSIEIIGLITILVGLIGFFRDPSTLVYALFCATLLGAAAAFVLESLGSTNISPAHLLLGFLVVKLVGNAQISQATLKGVALGKPGFWLLLTVSYAALSAYFMPRLFAGEAIVFAVRSTTPYSVPLAPAMSNFTQSVYLIGDFTCFIFLFGYASASSSGLRTLGKAALVCAVLNLVFAVVDLATYFTGTTELLSFIRNANYALLSDTELAGFKRIVGSFTEASSFGATTLGYFAYTSRLWLLGIKPRLTLTLSLLSLIALLFSTSTTSYVGLFFYAVFVYVQSFLHTLRRPASTRVIFLLVGLPLILLIVVLSIALNEDYSAYLKGLLDELVLNKMSTDSGVERSSWNRQAIQVFFDTHGFGAGNGSLRASSFPIAVLASLGILGSLFYALFLASVLANRPLQGPMSTPENAFRQAAKSVCIAWLIAASASGALTDLGLPFFVFAALACGRPPSPPQELPSLVQVEGYQRAARTSE